MNEKPSTSVILTEERFALDNARHPYTGDWKIERQINRRIGYG